MPSFCIFCGKWKAFLDGKGNGSFYSNVKEFFQRKLSVLSWKGPTLSEGFLREVESAFLNVWLEREAHLCASYLLINLKTCLWITPKLDLSVRTPVCQLSLSSPG